MHKILVPFVAALAFGAPSLHAATTFAADLPFRNCDGLICLDVGIDGVSRNLMLDTGNAHSTLIADVARDLHWSLDPAQRNGATVPGIYLGGEHRVALGAVQAPTEFYVFERAMLGIYQPPVDGSLTYDFFKDRVLEIDYPHHRVRVSNILTTPVPDKPQGSGSLKLITFGEQGPPVLVGSPFTVNGKNVRAQIDTVFTGTMLIYDRTLDMLGLHKEGSPELFRYTDGGVNLLASRSDSIGFAGRGLIGGPRTLYFVGEGRNAVHQPDGLFDATVGNALFANCVVTLDLHAMTIDVRTAAE